MLSAIRIPSLERDEAMRSCGIAGQTLMLAAKAMGYDSCPMIGFMIAVGKAVKPAIPKGGLEGPRPWFGNRGVSDHRDRAAIGKPDITGRAAGGSRSLSTPHRLA